jgi:hypothetical protein
MESCNVLPSLGRRQKINKEFFSLPAHYLINLSKKKKENEKRSTRSLSEFEYKISPLYVQVSRLN